ncbi:unnamed protein product, partial [Didymodactylos carnosus]
IGTSAVVYPAAGYAVKQSARGVPVVEVNIEETPSTGVSTFHFKGPAGELVPKMLLL